MPKCPNCRAHMPRTTKEWNFGRFTVKMYKCTKCGNQFREHFMGSTLRFVLSAHNGGLGKIKVSKETTDRHKTYRWHFSHRLFSVSPTFSSIRRGRNPYSCLLFLAHWLVPVVAACTQKNYKINRAHNIMEE
jgi:hypothetical protein